MVTVQQANAFASAYKASQPKVSSSSAPAGSVGATTRNASGQLINSAGEVVGGAVTAGGQITNTGTFATGTANVKDVPITKSDLSLVATPTLPNFTPTPTNFSSTIAGIQAGITPATSDRQSSEANLFQSMLAASSENQLPSGVDELRKLDVETRREEKAQLVQSYTNQIAAINTTAQADMLALEGQGRGQTKGFLGGEQARISKEATIAALRIAPLLAAAQGDLASAEAHIDRYFQLIMADATNKVNYKNKQIEMVYNFLSAEQKIRADDLKESRKTRLNRVADGVSRLDSFAKSVIDTNPKLAESLLSIGASRPDPDDEDAVRSWELQIAAAVGTGVVNGDVGESAFRGILQRSINTGATPEEAAQEANLASYNAGINVSQETINGWLREAKTLKKQTSIPAVVTDEQRRSLILSQPVPRNPLTGNNTQSVGTNPFGGLDLGSIDLSPEARKNFQESSSASSVFFERLFQQ